MNEPGEIDSPPQSSKNEMSRRKFLERTFTVLAGAAVTTLLPGDPPKPTKDIVHEAEPLKKDSVLVLDMFNISSFKKRSVEEYLRGKDITEAEVLEEIGVSDSTTLKGLQEGVPQTDDEAVVFLLNALDRYYSDHGISVMTAGKAFSDYLKAVPGEVSSKSIVEAVQYRRLTRDELGNPTLWVAVAPEIIEKLVSQSPDPILNMSFELGEIGFKYDMYRSKLRHPDFLRENNISEAGVGDKTVYFHNGMEISKEEYSSLLAKAGEFDIEVREDPRDREFWPQDGYFGEKTYKNLSQLTNVADTFPNRLFIAAAGNPSAMSTSALSDIRAARARLLEESRWPDNLLIIGIYGYIDGMEGVAARGADFYVDQHDLDKIGTGAYASFATPVITEIVRRLKKEGINGSRRFRDILRSMADSKNDNWVINFEKVKNYFEK